MFVKICGITREEDAEVAVTCGVSALGFIFWSGSPRCVTAERARTIVKTLPPFVTPVGVFVNESVDAINATADRAGLGAVQLHGDEPPAIAASVERPVVKAVGHVDAAAGWPARVLLLVDAYDPTRRGGTGTRADWDSAAELARTRPILLAGGLSPANVVEAVSRVRPFGVDVSSGVEDAPGIKNADAIRQLFAALRGVA